MIKEQHKENSDHRHSLISYLNQKPNSLSTMKSSSYEINYYFKYDLSCKYDLCHILATNLFSSKVKQQL